MLSVYKDSSDVSLRAPARLKATPLTFSCTVPIASFRLPKEAYCGIIAFLQDLQDCSYIEGHIHRFSGKAGTGGQYVSTEVFPIDQATVAWLWSEAMTESGILGGARWSIVVLVEKGGMKQSALHVRA